MPVNLRIYSFSSEFKAKCVCIFNEVQSLLNKKIVSDTEIRDRSIFFFYFCICHCLLMKGGAFSAFGPQQSSAYPGHEIKHL